MRAAGLGRGGSLDNAVVIDGDSILNQDGLRYDDEFVRHKALDCIGDLALAGAPILGHFKGRRTGHALNNLLAAGTVLQRRQLRPGPDVGVAGRRRLDSPPKRRRCRVVDRAAERRVWRFDRRDGML
jgi:UDP-3-O-[3-hydroxymyristoyl] N-acetylglucosamine deacetylase